MSKIEWTEETWNPATGCTKLTAGCDNCYAERMALRLQAMGETKYRNGFVPTTHAEALGTPFKWKRPRKVFVCSMSDLFHHDVSQAFIKDVFDVMHGNARHTFQVLTKRSGRMLGLSPYLPWPENVWAGVSVENEGALVRVKHLRKTGAHVKFLSLEPLLGPLPSLSLEGVDWVIAGGESGPGARPVHPDWVREIRDKCASAGVPFFFKQWGGRSKAKTGRVLDGRTWDEFPEAGIGRGLPL